MDNNVERKMCSFCGVQGRQGLRFAGGLGAMMCEGCVADYHRVFETPAEAVEAARPPWEAMSDADILGQLPRIENTARQVNEFLVEWVELARSRKLSWAEIGKAFGTSRQAAWERFAQRVDGRNDRSEIA
ncbi:hypothetical protein [Nocardioides piscis]|uniref:ClpX-type ZB domain-containing protein n=1 Tax=Nocardioides piscis TaxID=2714938 RepID=A0A6G7YDM2_9ACTN|nr:hypothetical protein [Nocardioides piscis]QIK74893.1 hypothetical protein G7071_05065 [Nocardioides piscis]